MENNVRHLIGKLEVRSQDDRVAVHRFTRQLTQLFELLFEFNKLALPATVMEKSLLRRIQDHLASEAIDNNRRTILNRTGNTVQAYNCRISIALAIIAVCEVAPPRSSARAITFSLKRLAA